MTTDERVLIVLCSYNGADYISEQINSIMDQTHEAIHLLISDDGSTDNTLAIIMRLQAKFGKERISIIEKRGRNVSKNFIQALRRFSNYQYYAFSDQDDIWLPNKIDVAIRRLRECTNPSAPALYASTVEIVDQNLRHIGYSRPWATIPKFNNAIVQNFASGNTMVFNKALRNEVVSTPKNLEFVMHDWATYLICSALNGYLFFDHQPHIKYRQHQSNLIGSDHGLKSKIKSVHCMLNGTQKSWNDCNIKLLSLFSDRMSLENKDTLEYMSQLKSKSLITRIAALLSSNITKRTRLGYLSFCAAVILKKF